MLSCINRKKPSIAKLSKDVGFHHAHVGTVLREFEKEGIIKKMFNKEDANHTYNPGNPYKIELTIKGRLLNKVLQMFLMIKEGSATKELMKLLGIKAERRKNDKGK